MTPAGIDPEMTEPIAPELLARYLTGEASSAERASVDRWAALDPRNAAELRRLHGLADLRRTGGWDSDAGWSRTSSRLDETPVIVHERRRRVLAIAAALVLSIGAALVWRAVDTKSERAAQALTTEAGERRDLTLADGSRIELAPGTTIRVAEGYGNPERRVVLEGEAWFDVQHDAARPFRVVAAGTITEDLGTTFSVRARDGEPVRVVLVSGKASFGRSETSGSVELQPGDVALLQRTDSTPTVERGTDITRLVAWRQDRLDFRDAPVREVLTELGRWFAIDFRLSDSTLASRRITHTFAVNDLADALEVLSLSLGVRAERAGAVVTLR